MNKWNYTEPPKDRKILDYFIFCGETRINVVLWSKTYKTWITDLQKNHLDMLICWMELPKEPENIN